MILLILKLMGIGYIIAGAGIGYYVGQGIALKEIGKDDYRFSSIFKWCGFVMITMTLYGIFWFPILLEKRKVR